ncbi:UBA-like domain-containing protein 2, partial [Frankliniella fusca]
MSISSGSGGTTYSQDMDLCSDNELSPPRDAVTPPAAAPSPPGDAAPPLPATPPPHLQAEVPDIPPVSPNTFEEARLQLHLGPLQREARLEVEMNFLEATLEAASEAAPHGAFRAALLAALQLLVDSLPEARVEQAQ